VSAEIWAGELKGFFFQVIGYLVDSFKPLSMSMAYPLRFGIIANNKPQPGGYQ